MILGLRLKHGNNALKESTNRNLIVERFAIGKSNGVNSQLERLNAELETGGTVLDLLRHARLISEDLKVEEDSTWIKRELYGYKENELIPSYRHFNAFVEYRHPTRGWLFMGDGTTYPAECRQGLQDVETADDILCIPLPKEHCNPIQEFNHISTIAPPVTYADYQQRVGIAKTSIVTSIHSGVKKRLPLWIGEIENLLQHRENLIPPNLGLIAKPLQPATSLIPSKEIFISHSSADKPVADALSLLFMHSLHLKATDIRCTSVERHQLEGGANTEPQLKEEIQSSSVFVVILTDNVLQSPWVLMEAGARWGADKQVIPILSNGANPQHFGPLGGKNAIKAAIRDSVTNLLEQLARTLEKPLQKQSAYSAALDALVEIGNQSRYQERNKLEGIALRDEIDKFIAEGVKLIERLSSDGYAIIPSGDAWIEAVKEFAKKHLSVAHNDSLRFEAESTRATEALAGRSGESALKIKTNLNKMGIAYRLSRLRAIREGIQ